MKISLEQLNELDQRAFIEKIGWIFEHSPWVAERAWSKRPFASLEALHLAMANEVYETGLKEKLALLRAHPDLGTRVQMAEASVREQAGAGLDQLSQDEYEQFLQLNQTYTEKFGFPFIMAVKGQGKDAIWEAMNMRVHSLPESELEEALRQVCKIARFRLEEAMGAANLA